MYIPKLVSLLLGILLSLSVFAQSNQQSRIAELIPKQAENGKYGYVDSLDQWMIEPQFDTVSMFNYDGLAFVHDGGWSVIDTIGTTIIDQVHPDLAIEALIDYRLPESDTAIDRHLIRAIRLRGDSVALLHLDHGVLGTYPYILAPIQIERNKSVLSLKLYLDGYANGWKSISGGGVKILYNQNWQEVAHWVSADTHIDLTPDVAFAIHGKHETQVYQLNTAGGPREFDHVVEPFGASPQIVVHRYYVDDTFSNRQVSVQGQATNTNTKQGLPQKVGGQYLLTLTGDTLFKGKAETDFVILNKSLDRWGLPNVQIACSSKDFATCRALDASLKFLNGAMPVFANTDSTLWIYKDDELQLRRLEDGGILFEKSFPDLVHNNRSQFEQHPYVATMDSVYRLDRGNAPAAIYAIPTSLPPTTARLSNIRDTRYYAIRTVSRYDAVGLDINLSSFRNPSGWLYHYIEKLENNRFSLRPEGAFAGVYDRKGKVLIPPVYRLIGYRDSLFITSALGSSKRGLVNYDGRELYAPKAGLLGFIPKGVLTSYRLIDNTHVLIDSSGTVRSDTFQYSREDRSSIGGQKTYILSNRNADNPMLATKSVVINQKGELLSSEIDDRDIMCLEHRYGRSEGGGMVKATRMPMGPVGVRKIDGTWLIEPTYDSIPLVTDFYAIGQKNDSLFIESFKDGVTGVFPKIEIVPTFEAYTFLRGASKTEAGPQLDPCGLGYEKDGPLGPLIYSTCIAPDGHPIMPLTSEYFPMIFENNAIQLFHRDAKASVFFSERRIVDSLTFEKILKAHKEDVSQAAMEEQLLKIPVEIHPTAKYLLDSLNGTDFKESFRMNFKESVPWLTYTDSDTTLVFDRRGSYVRGLDKHQRIYNKSRYENLTCKVLSSFEGAQFLFSVDGMLRRKYPESYILNTIPAFSPKRSHSQLGIYGPNILPSNWRSVESDGKSDLLWLCGDN